MTRECGPLHERVTEPTGCQEGGATRGPGCAPPIWAQTYRR
jgi:hypothetical protein